MMIEVERDMGEVDRSLHLARAEQNKLVHFFALRLCGVSHMNPNRVDIVEDVRAQLHGKFVHQFGVSCISTLTQHKPADTRYKQRYDR